VFLSPCGIGAETVRAQLGSAEADSRFNFFWLSYEVEHFDDQKVARIVRFLRQSILMGTHQITPVKFDYLCSGNLSSDTSGVREAIEFLRGIEPSDVPVRLDKQ